MTQSRQINTKVIRKETSLLTASVSVCWVILALASGVVTNELNILIYSSYITYLIKVLPQFYAGQISMCQFVVCFKVILGTAVTYKRENFILLDKLCYNYQQLWNVSISNYYN